VYLKQRFNSANDALFRSGFLWFFCCCKRLAHFGTAYEKALRSWQKWNVFYNFASDRMEYERPYAPLTRQLLNFIHLEYGDTIKEPWPEPPDLSKIDIKDLVEDPRALFSSTAADISLILHVIRISRD